VKPTSGRAAPNVMFYCHNGLGLGHLSRLHTLARYLRTRWPGMSQLFVASSAALPKLALMEDAEYIKLPTVVRVAPEETEGAYPARFLPLSAAAIRDMRRDMILSIAQHLEPDALIVDHRPAGVDGELVPALRYWKDRSARTRLVLGLRDIPNDAPRARLMWSRCGAMELLEDFYDLILVYGQPDIFDLVTEFALTPRIADKTRYVGYLRRQPGDRTIEHIRSQLDTETSKLVLGMVGGGADGYDLLRVMLEAVSLPSSVPFETLLVAGPEMPAEDRQGLREMARTRSSVRIMDYVDDLASYVAAADVVVSRAGYNSVCEILSFERPAVLVPRVEVKGFEANPEQRLRAEALSQRGLVRMIHPAELTPGRLLQEVNALLEPASTMRRSSVNLNGLPAVAAELGRILQ
jgi:predicted glycosyltransferase